MPIQIRWLHVIRVDFHTQEVPRSSLPIGSQNHTHSRLSPQSTPLSPKRVSFSRYRQAKAAPNQRLPHGSGIEHQPHVDVHLHKAKLPLSLEDLLWCESSAELEGSERMQSKLNN